MVEARKLGKPVTLVNLTCVGVDVKMLSAVKLIPAKTDGACVTK